jgi:chromosome segregation ATPase
MIEWLRDEMAQLRVELKAVQDKQETLEKNIKEIIRRFNECKNCR